ncbi:MAG: hypothetical protein AAFV26_00865 [Pseudomonadota bacterium]
MDRREFLARTGAGAAMTGAALTAGTQAAADEQGQGPTQSPSPSHDPNAVVVDLVGLPSADANAALFDAASALGHTLRELSGSRLAFTYRLADTALPECVFVASHDHLADRAPALHAIAGLPGSSAYPSMLPAWLASGGGQMLWDSIAAEAGLGFKPLAIGMLPGNGGRRSIAALHVPLAHWRALPQPRRVQLELAALRGFNDGIAGAITHDRLMQVPVTDEAPLEDLVARAIAHLTNRGVPNPLAETLARSQAALLPAESAKNSV